MESIEYYSTLLILLYVLKPTGLYMNPPSAAPGRLHPAVRAIPGHFEAMLGAVKSDAIASG